LAQAKQQCRSDDLVYEDDLITEFNESAQASAENFINRSITERNFVMQCDKFETVTFERNYENDISKIEYYALVKLL
jgi:5'-deoxynucleotidase YfbR-like HD superfamily hydrolase